MLNKYKYIALNNKEEISGLVEAADEAQAQKLILEQGYKLISLRQIIKKGTEINLNFLNRVKNKDLVLFYRSLSLMISANVPIVKSLRIIAAQVSNPRFKKILNQLTDDVNEGMRFSDALKKHPKVFKNFFIYMIRSGEESGKFEEVLLYLAEQQEKDYEFRSKIKGALSYPIFIFSALIIGGAIMMTFVVPKMVKVLTESNIELPLMTKILISSSNFMRQRWYFIIILLAGLVVGLKLFLKSGFGQRLFETVLLKIPKFGSDLVQKIYLVRLARSLNLLLVGGVPLTQALRVTADAVGNSLYKDMLSKTAIEVEDGNPICSVWAKSPLIPTMFSQFVSIGEETGRVDEVLAKIGDFYMREVNVIVENFSKLLEPIIMLVMGGAVGFLVISIMLPMFKMSQAF